VADDTELGGVKLRKNTKVTAVLGSANHDPDVFDNPDAFDITRERQHLGFGYGIHECTGAPLVRLTAPVAFGTLIETFSSFEVGGLPQWQTNPYLRSVVNLPLDVG
jgi:cytochrome P450